MKHLFPLVLLIFLNSCGESTSENKNRNDVYRCYASDGHIELTMKSKEVITNILIEKTHKIRSENSKIYWKMGEKSKYGDFRSSNSFDKKTLEWVQTWNSKKLGVDRAPCEKIN